MAAITLVTMGSWGDLFPFVGLGRALVARGHDARLAASPAWEDVVVGAGVPFVGVGRRFGFEELRRHPEIFRRVPFRLRHALGRLVFDQIDELTGDLRDAMAGADLVVTHPAQVAAHNVAEHHGVPPRDRAATGPPCSCTDAWQTTWLSAQRRGGPHTLNVLGPVQAGSAWDSGMHDVCVDGSVLEDELTRLRPRCISDSVGGVEADFLECPDVADGLLRFSRLYGQPTPDAGAASSST